MPGWGSACAPTWGYHGDDGMKFELVQSSKVGVPYATTYGPGDVVGCGIDFEHGTIYYTKNGVVLPTAFEKVVGRLFPVIGIRGRERVRIKANFGQEAVFV